MKHATKSERQVAAIRYQRGETCTSIANEIECHPNTVRGWLHSLGITMRCRGPRPSLRTALQAEAVRLYKSGMTGKEISAELRVSVSSVFLWCHKEGVEIRTRGPRKGLTHESKLRQAAVIKARDAGMSFAAIGRFLGVSRQRVQQIHKTGTAKLP